MSLYALFSHPAHCTIADILGHFETDEGGQVTAITNEPDFSAQPMVWVSSIEILLRAAKAAVELFQISNIDISSHENSLRQLAQ